MLALYMLFGDLQLTNAASQYKYTEACSARGWAELVTPLQRGVFLRTGQNVKKEI